MNETPLFGETFRCAVLACEEMSVRPDLEGWEELGAFVWVCAWHHSKLVLERDRLAR